MISVTSKTDRITKSRYKKELKTQNLVQCKMFLIKFIKGQYKFLPMPVIHRGFINCLVSDIKI